MAISASLLSLAFRRIRKAPALALVVTCALAAGIGANTAAVTLISDVLFSHLPAHDPARLVVFSMRDGDRAMGLSYPEFAALRERQSFASEIGAWKDAKLTVGTGTGARVLAAEFVTPNTWRLLAIKMELGDSSWSTDPRSGEIPVLISTSFWNRALGDDPTILGKTLRVGNVLTAIAGIMPSGMTGLTSGKSTDIYLPMWSLSRFGNPHYAFDVGNFEYYAIGRLKPTFNLKQARRELTVLEPGIRNFADPSGLFMNQFFKDFHLGVENGRNGLSWSRDAYGSSLIILQLLIAFFLLLCAANIGLAMMSKVMERKPEYAIRLALGASRASILKVVLVETIVICLPGCLLGVGSGAAMSQLFLHFTAISTGRDIPHAGSYLGIFALSTGIALLTAIIAGILPAWKGFGDEPLSSLKSSGRNIVGRSRGAWMIAVQIAFGICLISMAAFTLERLQQVLLDSSGFQPRGVAFASIDFSAANLQPDQVKTLEDDVLRRLASAPGVEAVGLSDIRPLDGELGTSREFAIDANGHVHSDPAVIYDQTAGDYFRAVGTSVLLGNVPATPTASSCALSRSSAQLMFGDENPLGKNIYPSTFGVMDGKNTDPSLACRIVAVVDDAKLESLRTAAPRVVYQIEPPTKMEGTTLTVTVRGAKESLAIAALREVLESSRNVPAQVRIQSFPELIEANIAREMILSSTSGALALLAFILILLALYGFLMQEAVARCREFSIQLALGATRSNVLSSFLAKVSVQVVIGVFGGVAMSIGFSQVLTSQIALQGRLDAPQVGAGVVLTLAAVVIASVTPMTRIVRLDPAQALRAE